MNQLKRIMGVFWMVIAPVIIYFLIMGAVHNIGREPKTSINPFPAIIIIAIFTPIAVGLMDPFGWYALKGSMTIWESSTRFKIKKGLRSPCFSWIVQPDQRNI